MKRGAKQKRSETTAKKANKNKNKEKFFVLVFEKNAIDKNKLKEEGKEEERENGRNPPIFRSNKISLNKCQSM